MSLPTDAKARKNIPIYSGFIKYFPLAIAAVAKLSQVGNDQHNKGQPLHWDRSKSGDELDAQCRHLLDMAEQGEDATDTDEVYHATKNAWRSMANLEKLLEKKQAGPSYVYSIDSAISDYSAVLYQRKCWIKDCPICAAEKRKLDPREYEYYDEPPYKIYYKYKE